MGKFSKTYSVLPGFRLTLGYTLFYLLLIVIIPLVGLVTKSATLTPAEFWATVSDPRVVASFKVSFGTAFVAMGINTFFGFIAAWVLVRYKFPGKDIVDAMIDLPFALPTAVAGLALTALYASSGLAGQFFELFGIKVAYTPIGIIVALVFIGFPFVVRTVQPVLETLDEGVEEASATLGASRWNTFRRVIFPAVLPALLTGAALSFARCVGEYGSVVFISGNMPYQTEIVPLMIITKLEQYEYGQATAIALVMLGVSFLFLFIINQLQNKIGLKVRRG